MEIKVDINFFLPEEYKEKFEATKLEDLGKFYRLTVVEKEGNIPKGLKGKRVVLNGYKEKLEVIDHPTKAKLMYLEFYRRRWKEEGSVESYSNTYELHPNGCKLTRGFGNFLKGLAERERRELFTVVEGLEDVWEANKSLV